MDASESEKRKAILERLIKLSELANPDANQFQNEVSAASAKISEIMNKYSISWAEVEQAKSAEDDKVMREAFRDAEPDFVFKAVKAWHYKLAQVIANATNTKYFRNNHGYRSFGIAFYGLESQGDFACEMFIEWLGQIDRMSTKAQHEFVKFNGRNYESRYYRTSWIDGCLTQMSKNVWAEKQKARAENPNAIVLFETKLAQAYKERSAGFTHIRVGGSRGYSEAGYRHGEQAGAGLHIGSRKITGTRLLTG